MKSLLAMLLTACLYGAPPNGGARSGAVSDGFRHAAERHDFHVSYGRMAVEGRTIAVRLRFFADDLEDALRKSGESVEPVDWNTPTAMTRMRSYLDANFRVLAAGDTLRSSIAGSGEEVVDKEPMRWFLVTFEAPGTVENLDIHNRLLFDLFDDQKNIVRVQHFPSEQTHALYFTHDRPAYSLEF